MERQHSCANTPRKALGEECIFGHLGGEEGVRVDSDVQYSNSKVPGDSEVETKCYMRHSYFMQLRAVTLFPLLKHLSGKGEMDGIYSHIMSRSIARLRS